MSTGKKGFWKNFTGKKFLLIASYTFAATLAVGCVWNLIVKDPVSTLFTISALLHRAVTAIIVGFTLSGLIKTED